jgi:cysteine synthase B
VQPEDGAKIAGIRRWPKAYLPKIFDAAKVDANRASRPHS